MKRLLILTRLVFIASASATIPPAQQLQEANQNLVYLLLPDTRGGKMEPAAHQFRGREEEVMRITVEWLRSHNLTP